MKRIKDVAYVVSVHEDVSPGTLRINLRWLGNHEIFEFELDRLGEVVNCATETAETGWVMIEHSGLVNPGEAIPLR
jgi:hypothetical protein